MRTYHSNEKTSKPTNKRTLIAVLSSCAVIIAAVAIAIPLILANRTNNNDPDTTPLPTVKPISFVVPVTNYTIGMDFKIDELIYSSTLNQWRTHSGVDFIAAAGSDVLAIADGTVTDKKVTTLEGNVVTITHKDGYVSIYKSLSDTIAVNIGDEVAAGDKIGTVDVTMITELSVGAHLHLELKKNGSLVNPLDYIPHQGDK